MSITRIFSIIEIIVVIVTILRIVYVSKVNTSAHWKDLDPVTIPRKPCSRMNDDKILARPATADHQRIQS
jgi:hypothetical protein